MDRQLSEDRERLAHELVKRGGRIESSYDNEIVVTGGKPINHPLHFILSCLTLGVWAVLVWLPICILGRSKTRTVTVREDGSPTDTRLPNELPAPALMVGGAICGMIVLYVLHVPFIWIVVILVGGAALVRSLANRR